MVTSMKIRTRILSILRKFGSSIRVLPSFRSLVHAYTRNLPQNIICVQRGRRYEYFKERNFTRIVTPRGIFQFFCFAYSRYRYKLCTRVLTGRERYIFPYVFFFRPFFDLFSFNFGIYSTNFIYSTPYLRVRTCIPIHASLRITRIDFYPRSFY